MLVTKTSIVVYSHKLLYNVPLYFALGVVGNLDYDCGRILFGIAVDI